MKSMIGLSQIEAMTGGKGTSMLAVVYSNGNQESKRAISLLQTLDAQILEYHLNAEFTQRGFVAEFGEEAEYPQINIEHKHIGGLKETMNYLKQEGAFE